MEYLEHFEQLKQALKKEEEEQNRQWLDENASPKELRNKGLAIYPLIVSNKSYGYADYPVLTFGFSFPFQNSLWKGGTAVSLFQANTNESITGILNFLDDYKGQITLHCNEFPDWIDEGNCGVRLIPDNRSFQLMQGVLKAIKNASNENLNRLVRSFYVSQPDEERKEISQKPISLDKLNDSQNNALNKCLSNLVFTSIQGPPGTGKTVTLIACVRELVKKGERVAVVAPSNAAVDHFAMGLLKENISIYRTGNFARVRQEIEPFTAEGILKKPEYAKELKRLRIRINEFRKMSRQYKRNFGQEEREQRKLIRQETKALQAEYKKLTDHFLSKAYYDAQVILGTPVSLHDELHNKALVATLIIDEAGQCLEPMAWLAMQYAEKVVLAGDYWQLPPTVISQEAEKMGLASSILEQASKSSIKNVVLDKQYRMPAILSDFSSDYFYDGKVSAFLENWRDDHLQFIDTAGIDYVEKIEENNSIVNESELALIAKWMEQEKVEQKNCVLISPYAGQVSLAKKHFPKLKVSTIDSFQGQESEIIILSLVRSNSNGVIGFLKDYRRMNVAITRAKNQLVIFGDSSTLGNDVFYTSFLEYIETKGMYRSVFEFEY